MHTIVLIEDGCCHPGELDGYQEFLRSSLGERATVTKVGVGGHLGFSAIAPELGNRLLAQGAGAVPIVAVDGHMLHHGSLPDWETSLAAIEQHISTAPASDPVISAAPVSDSVISAVPVSDPVGGR